jgi:hypothetical protein
MESHSASSHRAQYKISEKYIKLMGENIERITKKRPNGPRKDQPNTMQNFHPACTKNSTTCPRSQLRVTDPFEYLGKNDFISKQI